MDKQLRIFNTLLMAGDGVLCKLAELERLMEETTLRLFLLVEGSPSLTLEKYTGRPLTTEEKSEMLQRLAELRGLMVRDSGGYVQ